MQIYNMVYLPYDVPLYQIVIDMARERAYKK